MFFKNNLKEYYIDDLDISYMGFEKLFKFYLESKDLNEKKYIYKNISKVTKITETDIFEIIKYCSIYNRSYKQIKFANDHTLFNSTYLSYIKIIIDLFKEKLEQLDNNNEYIAESNNEYDYFDLITYYLKLFKEDNIYEKSYEIFNIIVFNDLKIFYKILFLLLTDKHFTTMKCSFIYEMFHLKDILLNYLSISNDITILKKEIEDKFIHIPTVTGSSNYHELIQLLEIRNVCCDKSVTFLYDGYQLMNFYNENNFFDYSAVSLQFFKVIEIELKEKVLNHCIYELDKKNLFYGLSEIMKLNNFYEDFISKLELGKVRYLLKHVKTLMYDIREENEITYFNSDTEIFLKRMISLFVNVKTINFYLDILNSKVVELYRNSAVHTGILSYERANQSVEITKVFLKNIKELNYSFKLSNIINLKLYDTPIFLTNIIKDISTSVFISKEERGISKIK